MVMDQFKVLSVDGDWCGGCSGWGKSCRSVSWVWAPSIFGDDLKCHSESQFTRPQEATFSLRRGGGEKF